MTISIDGVKGHYVLEAKVQDELQLFGWRTVSRSYSWYTKREAIKRFKDYLKEQGFDR